MGRCQDLLEAARNGNTALLSKILQHKGGPLSRRSPSINFQDVNGYTALHHACLNGHYEIVKVLLTHHAVHGMPDIRGSTPLYLAAWAGNVHIVNLLLMLRGIENIDAQTIENETALHCAAQHGHNAVVSALLARGADPTIRNNSFQSPLDLAAQFGRLEVVQTLINKHPELIEPYRVHDEVVTVENGRSPPYKITPTKHIFTQSCLHLAARNGHNDVVKALLAAGVDVNTLTHSGSAMHEAALCGKKNIVCTLLSADIDLHALDGTGRTALDILKEYPTNVTYEILTIINDFCQTNSSSISENQFRPIKDVNDNHKTSCSTFTTRDTGIVTETSDYEHPHHRSLTVNSLDRYKNITDRYTPMQPIKWTKSNSDLSSNEQHEQTPEYKSIYKSNLLHRRLGGIDKQFPKFSTIKELQNHSPRFKSTLYQCVDEYVEMTMPNSSSPRTPVASPLPSQPVSSPTECMEYSDYANINIINAHIKHECHDAISLRSNLSFDSNNNNRKINNVSEHSPTPDCPPPSALEAQSTIYEFVKPTERSLKRKSLLLQQQDTQFYDGLKTFIWENQVEPQDDQLDSLSSSQVSECVEEFVGDVPFAGLFKGSSLNLAIASSLDLRQSVANDETPSGLRSPSIVRSIKPIDAKHNDTNNTPTNFEDEYDFDVLKAWDEINTIFESIGNEVATKDARLEDLSEHNSLHNTLRKKTLTMRKPAELLLDSGTQEQNSNPNWCHTANTLIYGSVIYNVFYLGSTVIRELHGTASTRKSIQKLKREETPAPREDTNENDLIKDINSSTRILKATNEQTRLEVGIAVSHAGVRFIENENESTICVHDIENINCVSQDTDDLRYFAYITRENDIHYCHVFMVDDLNLATEIILTLGQAFEVAYQLSLISQEDSLETIPSSEEKRLSFIDIVDNI